MNRFLNKAAAGDREAEEQLFRILRARFTTIAKRRIREPDEAEDIVQQACTTVLEKYKTAVYRRGFETWVYTVLRMKIGNYLQSRKVRQERFADDTADASLAASVAIQPDWDMETALIDCLKKIVRVNQRYARALSLSYQGYGAAEMAERLGVTRSNMYSIMNRGRSLLSQCLETGRV